MEITITTDLSQAESDLFDLIGGDTPNNRNTFLSALLHQALERRIKWVDTFKSRIDKTGPIPPNHTTPCWTWTGGKIPSGYGIAHDPITNKITLAHRLIYELTKGPIPSGMIIMHSCDNRICVNPDHHTVGTHKENTADMYAKKRENFDKKMKNQPRGRSHYESALTEPQVEEIESLYATGTFTYTALGKRFGVTRVTISNIVNKKTWRSRPTNEVQ